ncbi:hypothetical protein J6590_054833 [Homalodisca vitripennis]|nr:hypothetical protein J6590_054833 [Homalodisca vitripennis]
MIHQSSRYENTMNVAVNKIGKEKEGPLPIIKCIEHMSGIGRKDQLISFYIVFISQTRFTAQKSNRDGIRKCLRNTEWTTTADGLKLIRKFLHITSRVIMVVWNINIAYPRSRRKIGNHWLCKGRDIPERNDIFSKRDAKLQKKNPKNTNTTQNTKTPQTPPNTTPNHPKPPTKPPKKTPPQPNQTQTHQQQPTTHKQPHPNTPQPHHNNKPPKQTQTKKPKNVSQHEFPSGGNNDRELHLRRH